MNQERPSTQSILQGLKDFQRDAVEYVFQRLYLDDECTRRFLVADEVGLGKTLVARGVIAKTIDHLWDRTDRIDIVYVCSNADIARQNIQRLNVTGRNDVSHASRITLLPLKLPKMDSRLNFVSFTPGTSFDLKSSSGVAEERALLFWLLHEPWSLDSLISSRPFEGWSEPKGFRNWLDTIEEDVAGGQIHQGMAKAFVSAVNQRHDLRTTFNGLVSEMPPRRQIPEQLRRRCLDWISELRRILAETCLHWLEPDLIILDEFQRFKHLLKGDADNATEAAQLAEHLFSFQQHADDPETAARVLLLSATPYKMYTQGQEAEQDDHYEDFQTTLDFLLQDESKRLRWLHHDTIGREAWKLLWVPPSCPYYEGSGPFANPDLERFTKRLIFSAWRVVPKAIASVLSYEAERSMMQRFRKSVQNTAESRKRRRALLRFTFSKGRPTGMPVLAMLYPCRVFADQCDPLRIGRDLKRSGQPVTAERLRDQCTSRIRQLLSVLVDRFADHDQPTDERWYWAAPLLMDWEVGDSQVEAWFQQPDLARIWSGGKLSGESDSAVGWARHVDLARQMIECKDKLGSPPEDLADVLSLLAIAGPGTVSLRALERILPPRDNNDDVDIRSFAGPLAHSFLHLFNLPEVIYLLRDRKKEIVLASTSVGQEGLDFHPYCHAVVHWNLPSNPVDLEQREGRVHRYKGHALRKNIASAFADISGLDKAKDPWEAMFTIAKKTRPDHENDLFPFWIVPNGEAKIERHVPALPHSREQIQKATLGRSLVLYRMVFGQNRQEDLVDYLANQIPSDQLSTVVELCRIDLSPPVTRAEQSSQLGETSDDTDSADGGV